MRNSFKFEGSGDKNKLFSNAFYKKLAVFDKDILEILGLEKQIDTFDDFFDLTTPNLKKLSTSISKDKSLIHKSMQKPTTSVKVVTNLKEEYS